MNDLLKIAFLYRRFQLFLFPPSIMPTLIPSWSLLSSICCFKPPLGVSCKLTFGFGKYGGNIVKAHVGRWSEDCPEHQAVVVYSMDDTPLVSIHNPLHRPVLLGVAWLTEVRGSA